MNAEQVWEQLEHDLMMKDLVIRKMVEAGVPLTRQMYVLFCWMGEKTFEDLTPEEYYGLGDRFFELPDCPSVIN